MAHNKGNMANIFSRLRFGRKSAKRHSADYSRGTEPIQYDETSSALKDFLSTDPDLAANVRRFVDNVLIESPTVVPRDDDKVANSTIKKYNEQLREVRFYKIMRAAMYNLVWNGNAFFEIKFNGTKLKEMYAIDPETIKIVKNPNTDEVVRYEQEVSGSKVAVFQPDEIIHISIDHLDTAEWGKSFMKPLHATLVRKEIAEFYLQWLIQNDKFAPIVNVKSDVLNVDQWNQITDQINLKKVQPDFLQIINTFPDDMIELIRIFNTDDFDRIQGYINEQKKQIMTLLQVPPIIAGSVDDSNRSNSEIQARLVFYNTIKAFQNLVKEELDIEMLTKLKWNKVQFKFPEVDERANVELLKLAKTMKDDLRFTEDAILAFLKDNGFKIPKVEKIFEDPEVIMEGQGSGSDNNNEAPSREPRDKSGLTKNEGQRLDDRKAGVSSDAN
jgi:hypothetical protein